MSSQCSPEKTLSFLSRKTEPETVCVVESGVDNIIPWMDSFVQLLDKQNCDKYSVNRRDLEIRVQWTYDGPEHVIRLFKSYEEACISAYGSVCLTPTF